MVVSNRNLLFQGAPIFRGELLVSGRVSNPSFEGIQGQLLTPRHLPWESVLGRWFKVREFKHVYIPAKVKTWKFPGSVIISKDTPYQVKKTYQITKSPRHRVVISADPSFGVRGSAPRKLLHKIRDDIQSLEACWCATLRQFLRFAVLRDLGSNPAAVWGFRKRSSKVRFRD